MQDATLSEKTARLLRIMDRMGPRMNTNELTRESGLTNDLVGYHMGRLIDEGFVEDTEETADVGAVHEAKIYAITNAGRERTQELLGELQQEAEVEGVDGSEVRELRETVGHMKGQIETLFDRIEELERVVEDHQNVIDQARSGKR